MFFTYILICYSKYLDALNRASILYRWLCGTQNHPNPACSKQAERSPNQNHTLGQSTPEGQQSHYASFPIQYFKVRSQHISLNVTTKKKNMVVVKFFVEVQRPLQMNTNQRFWTFNHQNSLLSYSVRR